MSKISNTTVYPNILPTANDYVVLTDVEDNNETKTARVQDFQAYFGVSTAEVTLTPTQVLNSFTNPVDIVPAQGANKYIIPYGTVVIRNVQSDPVPVAYAFGGNIPKIKYDNTFFADIPFGIFQTVAQYTGYAIMAPSGAGNIVPNLPLQFFTPVANPTLGNSNIVISVQYRIVEIA
tara:strand:- start:227 stop:757 length:531 start_codon:yes stop_codon:yes gene_type:complete